MKTKLFITALLLGTVGLFSFTQTKSNKDAYCHYGQCMAFKKDGTQCHSCAQQGRAYCWSHNN